jgi:hypothetical protein
VARRKKQSYRTSRQEIVSRPETFEEKMVRVRREVEEIKMDLQSEQKDDDIIEWESLIRSISSETTASKLFAQYLQKSQPTTQPSSTQVPPIPSSNTENLPTILLPLPNKRTINPINASYTPRIPPRSPLKHNPTTHPPNINPPNPKTNPPHTNRPRKSLPKSKIPQPRSR